MAKCQIALDRNDEAERYALAGAAAYPGEPQARHLIGMARLGLENYEAALEEFNAYEELLPGNPYTIFLQGLSREGMGQRKKAAERFSSFLELVDEEDEEDEEETGDEVEYSRQRLREWGFLEED